MENSLVCPIWRRRPAHGAGHTASLVYRDTKRAQAGAPNLLAIFSDNGQAMPVARRTERIGLLPADAEGRPRQFE
ncbi:hypothetical protein [Chromobacterium vaccinii]|uniref:hypothetical protein n=1 Tax=Chromobacterium vaccinii TaxID=1108595 RepID=UPI0013649193|nr:hypothetical protein [Chromobacterium vaccinii]